MKKIWIIGIIILFLGASVVSGLKVNQTHNLKNLGLGNIIYVGGYGPGNYTKIQYAINNASNGDTIYVYSGTYYEYITIAKSITLTGEDKNTTIIDAQSPPPGPNAHSVVYLYADGVTIDGFTIKNGVVGIYHYKTNNHNIYGNIITNHYYHGIALEESSYNNIYDNIITESSHSSGLFLICSPYNNISENTIIENCGYGIDLRSSDSINICGNIISENDWNGINGDFYQSVVSGNTITKNDNAGICLYGSSSSISGNIISNNGGYGIEIHGASINIIGNEVANNSEGIYLKFSDNNSICENNVINNKGDGIDVDWSNGNDIYDNIIKNNSNGIYVHEFGESNVISENNITGNNDIGVYLEVFSGYVSTIVYHNIFINNNQNAYDITCGFLDSMWGGNYWDDYNGEDNDGNGVGDTPYPVGESNWDYYPCMAPENWPNIPPQPPLINGYRSGSAGEEYEYNFITKDLDGDSISYYVDWGDNTNSGWTEFVSSSTVILLKHTWNKEGAYSIKAKTKDIYEAESYWSALSITMPRNLLWSQIISSLQKTQSSSPSSTQSSQQVGATQQSTTTGSTTLLARTTSR